MSKTITTDCKQHECKPNPNNIFPYRESTPEEIAFMTRIRAMKECPRCKTSPITSFAQSFFTWSIICSRCWYKELEVMDKLKQQGKNIKKLENIGYIPAV